ncbi:SRPBCC domain-containing protein [Nonomuraea diastatica]|uniref:SRPBCC domain-containing protein n=1 Tax=Nonomuraea diastatica TaxID=1848329 RepID=A0A4V2YG39_9ACTN|nr:SRPBCC domain-containing protein [Nonomuraea diastatica]TDD25537.1 SRPBCC domain-containing protein [Nonomuraea diastatica]
MHQIRTEIHIAASPEQVWKILCDFDAYPEWNPLVPRMRGAAVTGSRLSLPTALGPEAPSSCRCATVEDATPPRRLAWRTNMIARGVASSVHAFELSPDEDRGGTHVRHQETVTGAAAPLMWPMLRRFEPVFERLNQALKSRAEAAAPA